MSGVLITPRSLTTGGHGHELGRLEAGGHQLIFSPTGRLPTHQELVEMVSSCEAWLAGVEQIDRRIFDAAPNLRIIARFGVGLDSIDLKAAEDAGVTIVPSTGSNAEGVAELTILHALAARRPHHVGSTIVDPQAWQRQVGSELQFRRAAVIGYGAIGSRVARLLESFGMQISTFDPFASPALNHNPSPSINEAITDADLVTLHCPPTDKPLIGSSQLRALALGATLINTARGSLIDMDAVLGSLDSGHLGAYCCDAFVDEPPVPHSLWNHPHVYATPHIGGFTIESGQRSAAMAVDAILANLG